MDILEERGIDIMGHDYRADKNGVFELHFIDCETGERIKDVYLTGLKPYQRMNCDLITGNSR